MKNTGYKLYIVNGKLYMTLFFIFHLTWFGRRADLHWK